MSPYFFVSFHDLNAQLKGLKANVSQMPLEEGPMLRQDPLKLDLLNEDSSSRKWSSSLTEQVWQCLYLSSHNISDLKYQISS